MKKIEEIKKKAPQGGFTLIEILIVIGIIAVLAAIVLVAVNPKKQFEDANNAQRFSNVNAILSSIGQFIVDNKGQLPSQITSTVQDISSSGSNLCSALMPKYISALPGDPTAGTSQNITSCTSYNSGYTVVKDSNDRITVSAPAAQQGKTISVTR